MDDLEFVQRCVKGDKLAWDEFVDRYSRLIYSYIHSILKIKGVSFTLENIEDLFQEIFFLLVKDNFNKLKSFKAKNGCSLASWLRQVTINYTIDFIRKSRPEISLDEENENNLSLKNLLSSNAPNAAQTLEKEELLSSLKECIDILGKDDRYFLELHINRGLDLEGLKDLFKVSRGAIDMRKSRIIERLKDCFKSKGFVLDF